MMLLAPQSTSLDSSTKSLFSTSRFYCGHLFLARLPYSTLISLLRLTTRSRMGRRKRLRITTTNNPIDDHMEDQSHQQHSQVDDHPTDQQSHHQNSQGDDHLTDSHHQNSQEEDQTIYQHDISTNIEEGSEQGTQKKGRGHTKKSRTWKMSSDSKIVVTFNKFGKPVGEEGNELTQFLGTLVRMADHVGIQYEDWRKVPPHKKWICIPLLSQSL